MEEYYEQRTTKGGLLITEATFISEDAGGYTAAPGLYSNSQVINSIIIEKKHY